jgi:hypothetical protein
MQTDDGVDMTPMSDAQLHKLLREEWVGVIGRLWDAIGKPIEQDRLASYMQELKQVPLGLLEKAISRVLRENTYNVVPTIGKVWEALRKELGCNPNDLAGAVENWRHQTDRSIERSIIRVEQAATPGVQTHEHISPDLSLAGS